MTTIQNAKDKNFIVVRFALKKFKDNPSRENALSFGKLIVSIFGLETDKEGYIWTEDSSWGARVWHGGRKDSITVAALGITCGWFFSPSELKQ